MTKKENEDKKEVARMTKKEFEERKKVARQSKEEIREKREKLRKLGFKSYSSMAEAFRACGLSTRVKKSDVVSLSVSQPKVEKSK